MIMYVIGSLDSLKSDCRSFSDLKTVTGSRPKNVTNHGLALRVQRQPRVRPAIYTALLDRLAVVNRHMIVWIEWVPSIP